MKVIFLGTSEFAVASLKAICQYHDVIAVVTQPDRPVGRNKAMAFSPVKQFAISQNIPVLQYEKISKEGVEELKNLRADIMITASYGQMLSKDVLESTRFGVYNVHGSLLPKYRGASPIQTAVLNGDKITGISILKTGIGMDDGPVLLEKELDIKPEETSEELFIRMADLGADCIVEALELIENNRAILTPQDASKATFCKMIKKEYAEISFDKPVEKIVNMVRAYQPWPIAFTHVNNSTLQIFKARRLEDDEVVLRGLGELSQYDNGEVVSCNPKTGFIVKALDGFLNILEVKPENGKRMMAKDYLNGNRVFLKMILGETK